jgi:transglycosylase-like protein
MRRLRFLALGAVVLLFAALVVLRLLAGRLERRIEARIVAEAKQRGAVARVESVRVGLWPPVRVRGLVLDKAGVFHAEVGEVTALPSLRGSSGLRPLVRVGLGPAVLSGPGGLALRLRPTTWDWKGGSAAELADAPAGSGLRAVADRDGQRVDVEARQLDVARLVDPRIEPLELRPGPLDGELHWARGTDGGQDARWRVRASFAESTGSVRLAVSPSRKLDLSVEVERLDFAGLLGALGVERPLGSGALGSLAAVVTASAPLDDPAAASVTQRLDYAPPSPLPPELVRLRGDFVHELVAPGGQHVRIDVSAGSADFVARAALPPLFVKALLLAEDSAFFSHRGLDLGELPKALVANWAGGGAVRGASTLTQQLAKNLFLTRERSLARKLQELPLAFLLEAALGKDRILEIYVNVIEWGPGVYGLRPAARYYFDKEPGALTPKETAFLVVMIPGPVKYQRSFREGVLSAGLEPLVANLLAKLRSVDALGEEDFAAALAEPLAFRRADEPTP